MSNSLNAASSPTPLHDLANQILDELRAIRTQLAAQDRSKRITWLTGEEACDVLGINITVSGSHLRRLAWLRRQGFLTRFGSTHPYTYDREEIMVVLDKLKSNKLYLPTKI